MKFIELFAGIGGFRYGLESINRSPDRRGQKNTEKISETGQGLQSEKGKRISLQAGRHNEQFNSNSNSRTFTCVYANEWDKYACQIYRKNFGKEELYEGDITKIDAGNIPDHDLLCGGVPCQAWSIAGKRGGFEDSRGTMWFECFRIIKAKKPKYILLENVKGILSHNAGNSFERICECICELGYAIDFEVLNSKNFGVPQNRERVFIIGIRLDLLDKCQVF